jgi:hypothetical protein
VHLVLVVDLALRLSEEVVAYGTLEAETIEAFLVQPSIHIRLTVGRRLVAEVDENREPAHHSAGVGE